MDNHGEDAWYSETFETTKDRSRLRENALKQALDIRKFEIELYWKRATYFWAFIAATFTGYFVVQRIEEPPNYLLVLLCNLGFVFSYCWYLVNKGSKYWQNNWENHVDRLEDKEMGPLYKTILEGESLKKSNISKEFSFSVSKINQILSFYIMILWVVLSLREYFLLFNLGFLNNQWITIELPIMPSIMLLITIWFLAFTWFNGTSDVDSNKKVIIKKRD
ncbi:hypothetical protein [Halobacillus mangrovi]|uniref:RipA family octameric membrane protein n=1 Tax=Halobacillus mangrovi TaxID=402384 RepID=UPI003D959861